MSTDKAPTAETYRDALAAVLDAIAIPDAATVGHEVKREEIVTARLMHVRVFLDRILDEGDPRPDIEWSIRYLRERLAEHPPVGYVTAEQARERVSRGLSWPEAVALPEEANREHAG